MSADDEERERLAAMTTAAAAVANALDEFEADDEEARRVLARLRHVVGWAQTLSETSEPDLVSQGMVDRATTALDAVATHVRAAPEDPTHVTRAAAYADQFLDGVAGWPLPAGDKKAGLAKREIEDLRKIATRATADAEKEIARLDERLEEQAEESARLVAELRDTATTEVNDVKLPSRS